MFKRNCMYETPFCGACGSVSTASFAKLTVLFTRQGYQRPGFLHALVRENSNNTAVTFVASVCTLWARFWICPGLSMQIDMLLDMSIHFIPLDAGNWHLRRWATTAGMWIILCPHNLRKFIVAFMMLTVFCVDAETTYIFFGRWAWAKFWSKQSNATALCGLSLLKILLTDSDALN